MADKPVLGWDYDLERWSDGSRDEEGKLIWNERYPNNDEWHSVRMVTLNFDPEAPAGDGDYRNYPIHPGRPLDPYQSGEGDFYYDLDDLALSAFIDYGFEF